ncbi:MAG: SprB repeat-containing protein [Bacteroidetes bacterium]|nr:SprB repeat-containing protein [Bacteroidota bacterium]
MKKNSFVRRISPLLFLFLFSAACTYGQLLNVTMSTTPSCSLNGTATATVTGGTPPYSYAWYSPSPLVGSIPWSTSNTITGMPGSPYYVSVTDAGSGYGSTSFIIPSAFTATRSVTHDQCGAGVGTASVAITGGTPPFSYNWSNGQNTATATGLSPGIYFVTITDAAGCFISSQTDSLLYFQIWNTSPRPPYTYVWSTIPPQFTPSVTGLGVGSHYVTVTDAAGCSNEKSFYISQLPNGITANVTTTNEFCQQSNGTASLMVSGGMAPYTYLWSNGATTSSIAGLSYGSYAVTVTDALGCPKVAWAIVHRTDPLTLTITGTQANCSNTGGSASVTVAGGTPPYTYVWSNGATTNAISGLSAGYYYVHVTDGNGCQDYSFYHCIQPQSCFATISGNLLSDMNSNCFPDGADYVLEGKIVQIGSTWTTSNSNGDYSKTVLPGSYAISQGNMLNNFQVVCPGNRHDQPEQCACRLQLSWKRLLQRRFQISTIWKSGFIAGPHVPQQQTVWIYYRNIGTTILNSTLTFTPMR